MIRAAAALTLIASLAAAPALYAQGSMPDSENGRYTFHQQGDELLRLDGRLGHVSLCSKRGAGWACLTVPEERTALEAEIARLHAENAALKRKRLNVFSHWKKGLEAYLASRNAAQPVTVK